MANFHNNYLVIAAREPEMLRLLTLMGTNFAQGGDGSDVSMEQIEAATGVRGLFDAIADSLEWDYCQAFQEHYDARPMSDSAGVRLTRQRDVWVLAMDYDTANESNFWDVEALFDMLPEGVGDYGLALFDSDEYDDYESVCARSWLLEGVKDSNDGSDCESMTGPLQYRQYRAGYFSPESLLKERSSLAESQGTAASLAEVADRAALNGWSPSGLA